MKEIHRRTPAGETIVAAVDMIDGKERDRTAINQYVTEVIKRWENTNQFYAQVPRLWVFSRFWGFPLLFGDIIIVPIVKR